MANFIYVRQKGTPKGNARPVLNAQHLIDDNEPFFVFFADDFFHSSVPRAVQLKSAYEQTGKSIVSLIEVNKKDADKYAMAVMGEKAGERTFQIRQLIEKPGEAATPSNFASVGGYLLTPDIIPIIAKERTGKGGEIVLADSINELAMSDAVYGQFIDGTYHDTGDPMKYLMALVDVTLKSDVYGEDFANYLKKRL